MLHLESQGGNQVLWCHLISHWGSHPVPLNSSLLFLDCHKETTWLQHFESEFKTTRQLKKLLCIFLMTRKINVVQSISHIHGGKTGTMGLREKQMQEIISPRGRRHRHRAVLPSPTHLSPSAQRESPCCSTEVSQHCWLAPQWFVRPKCTIVSLLVICQTVSSFNHTGQTSSEKGRVCYELGLINIWVWLLRTVHLNSYFIIKTYPRQGQQNTSVWPRPKYRDGLGHKASSYS